MMVNEHVFLIDLLTFGVLPSFSSPPLSSFAVIHLMLLVKTFHFRRKMTLKIDRRQQILSKPRAIMLPFPKESIR